MFDIKKYLDGGQKEFADFLKEKYSDMYEYLNKPAEKGVLMEPIQLGLDIGPGWYKIIETLSKQLSKEKGLKVVQVKEKFGGLRFYVHGGSDFAYKKINNAEKKSYTTCEECGNRGKLREDLPWWRTLCEICYNKSLKKN